MSAVTFEIVFKCVGFIRSYKRTFHWISQSGNHLVIVRVQTPTGFGSILFIAMTLKYRFFFSEICHI